MRSEELWRSFLDTGAPELYLLYTQAKKREEPNVLDNIGPGTADHQLQ